MITFTYTPKAGPDITVSVKGPDFGSDEVISRRQTVVETMGDMIFVYSLAKDKLDLNIKLTDLDGEERGDLEKFFSSDNVDMALRWFTVDLPSFKRTKLRSGALVGGVVVKAGSTYKSGQRVKQDAVRYYVRLLTPDLTFVETKDGYFDLTLTLRVLPNFRPENFC